MFCFSPSGSLFMQDNDIPEIGYESEGLPQYDYQIRPVYTIGNNDGRSYNTDDPEPPGKQGCFVFTGVKVLVYKPQGKNHLSQRTVDYQQQRNIAVPEISGNKKFPVGENIEDAGYRGEKQQQPQQGRKIFPGVFFIEVPDIYVIGYYLPEHNGKIVSQPAVHEKHIGSYNT